MEGLIGDGVVPGDSKYHRVKYHLCHRLWHTVANSNIELGESLDKAMHRDVQMGQSTCSSTEVEYT